MIVLEINIYKVKMRNIQGIRIPNIGDYIYYRTLSSVLPGKVLSILNKQSINPTIIIEGHLIADRGKHIELLLSDVKTYPSDWKNDIR